MLIRNRSLGVIFNRIAWELGYDPPLVFETKSTSVGSDLFYNYNALARFHDAQLKKMEPDSRAKANGVSYLTYHALGEAIIRTNSAGRYAELLPDDFQPGFERRSIVLIDEVDKAPRDFPNDILNELERLFFRIPELGNVKVEADEKFAPVIIITSNSEKILPDPFLRRCVFHNIEFPNPERLEEIALLSIKQLSANTEILKESTALKRMIREAIDLFFTIRYLDLQLKKLPSTSELLLWLENLVRAFPHMEQPLLQEDPEKIVRLTLNHLVKYRDDREIAAIAIRNWIADQKNGGA